MNSFTIGSIASGMGMHLWGLIEIGGVPSWAIECDERIAEVYKRNHPTSLMLCNRAETISPNDVSDIDCLIATPSCKNASLLRGAGLQEQSEDISLATATANFIKAKRPKLFLLENVWQYRCFQSFHIIANTLRELGYFFAFWRLNCASFGVAQSRFRLYAVGVRGENSVDLSLIPQFQSKGWLEAIADIIPILPETTLAPWQKQKFPQLPYACLLKRAGGGRKSDRPYLSNEPSFTIRALGKNCARHWHQADIKIGENIYPLTPRAALRLFGDTKTSDRIWLPENNCLAMECVGNGASWVICKVLAQAVFAL
ncbi:DNA cytosine methyltransferase [Brasilonema sp. CT11]|nr:DNA cytosine methyltransferase [Brasilonema sp. CT11]